MAMDKESLTKRSVELLEEIQRIEKTRQTEGVGYFQVNNLAAQGANLIHAISGPKSLYAESLRNALKHKTPTSQWTAVAGVLQAFHIDLSKDRLGNIRHEVEAIVVSELISQAGKLLKTGGVHPAAAVIVACAGAEEFLRNWCEEQGVVVSEKQRSLNKFAAELRASNQIALPVERRIQSWADYRNDAAYGARWEKITTDIAERLVKEVEDFLVENRHVLG
ncbi:MAG: hypothetical protein JWN94_3150 [Betaproteobacteria bacterium]|nr:hypothetical protein [Betaproteobacteria bacterium]